MILGNPLGLLALLALPVLVVVEFLRPKERRAPATTLFLIEAAESAPRGGARLRRFANSLPFWLRVLAVLLVAWVLADPRLPGGRTVLRVAVVVDSTASMEAFRPEAETALSELGRLLGRTGKVEFVLLESHPEGGQLLDRGNTGEAVRALAGWKPLRGPHSPSEALETARLAAGPKGLRVFLTDAPEARVPPDVTLVAIGRPLANAHVAQASVTADANGRLRWRLLAGLSGAETARRELRIRWGDTEVPAGTLELEKGRLAALEGPWPEGVDRLTLALEPGDALAIDDVAPLLRPEPRPLALRAEDGLPAFFGRLAGTVPETRSVRAFEEADLELAREGAPPSARRRILLAAPDGEGGTGALSLVVAEPDPLTDGLSWIGFLGRARERVLQAGERGLLWAGPVPLVFLRERAGGRDLVLNFDWEASNAERLPAFLVLLARFAEEAREVSPMPWVGNLETGERLPPTGAVPPSGALALRNGPSEVRREASAYSALRAPLEPGYLEIAAIGGEEETPVLRAGVRFADVRESALGEAGANEWADYVEAVSGARIRELARDPLRELWMLLAGALLAAAWVAGSRKGGRA